MRSRSREINVFSISALDLFASALGAFILMAIVLMPYFLRTEPDVVKRLRSALSLATVAQAAAERKNAQLQRELDELRDAPTFAFPDLDVVIALDTTGSMASVVDGLRRDIDEFAELMLKLTPSLGIGLIDFEDECDLSTAVRQFPLRLMNPGGLSSLLSFSGSMQGGSAGCNDDPPEALAMALDAAVSSNWRPESEVRIIVIITDNPAYPTRRRPRLPPRAHCRPRTPVPSFDGVHEYRVFGPGTEAFLKALADAGNGNFTESGRSFVVTMLFALAGL